jgi:hypothetical protein
MLNPFWTPHRPLFNSVLVKKRSKLVCVVGALAVLLIVLGLFRGKVYLEAVGSYLAADNGVPPVADIVLVRSYGAPFLSEFQAAAKLFQEKKVAYILTVMHEPLEYQKLVGDDLDNQETAIASFFKRNRIPENCFSIIRMETKDPVLIQDAVALRPVLNAFAAARSWHRVVLIGHGYRMRRVLWSFQTFIGNGPFEFIPYSQSGGEVASNRWWNNNDTTSDVVSEYLKLIYFQIYHLRRHNDAFKPQFQKLGSSEK